MSRAKVPVLKYKDAATDLNLDVSIGASNGPAAIKVVKQLCLDLPPMKPLLYILKLFLVQR